MHEEFRNDPPPPAPAIGRMHFLKLAFAALAGAALSLLGRGARAQTVPVRVPAPQSPWSRAEFTYPGPDGDLLGMAIRLPESAGSGLFAVCLVCPHEGCIFGYESDYEDVSNTIGVPVNHPVFLCQCHYSTFDPLKGGEVIFGPSPRPPWRFTVREEAGEMVVSGVEPGVGRPG
jgi:nitrite reductase/ring-hydroxylating ferredoxin subunit